MRPRTRLTSPGGQEPEGTGRRMRDPRELYSPGFAIPVEPGIPARWPAFSLAFVAALLVVALIFLVLQVAGLDEQDDPSLGEVPSEAAVADR